MFQIIVEKLLKWDMKKKEGTEGIAGIVEAWGNTTEEQGRLTLHGHMLLWIKWFAPLRLKLFSDDINEKNKAICELKEYISQVMSASYMGFEVDEHFEKDSTSDICHGELKQVPDQTLRDMRHNRKSIENKGIITKCEICCATFSTNDLLNHSLKKWKPMTDGRIPEDTTFPLSRARKDVYAMRYPYEVATRDFSNTTTFDKMMDCIVKEKFNEHDFNHRPSCFKKGPECRFHIPKPKNEDWLVYFGDEESKWYLVQGGYKKVTSFDIVPKRLMGDQFLNVFCPTVSGVFGYNSNIQIGDVAHIYYNTLYGSKSTQDDDTKDFIKVCNVICRRIQSQRDNEENIEDSAPEFIEGLSRILIGIRTHISSYVIGTPLAYHLLTKGSRFEFSHDFASLLLGQMEDFTSDMELSFKIRQRKSNNRNESERWIDCFTNNIIYRPDELEEVCAYQQVMEYEVIQKSSKRNNSNEGLNNQLSDDCEDGCEDNDVDNLRFKKEHPGYKFVKLKKTKHIKVPIIYSSQFDDIELLEMEKNQNDIGYDVKKLRENYARKALLLFLPFRNKDDLVNQNTNSYWDKFEDAKRFNQLYPKALDILQNIQDRHNANKIKKRGDWLHQNTSEPQSDDINEENNQDNTEEDDLDQLIPDDLLFLNSDVTARGDSDVGTFEAIIDKSKAGKINVSGVHVLNQNIFLDTIIEEDDSDSDSNDNTQNNNNGSWENF